MNWEKLMVINHELVHAYIAALSCTKEGRELIANLEEMRYYHRDGNTYKLGYGAFLAVSWGVNEDGHYFVAGEVLLPGKRDKLRYKSAAWKGEDIDAALYWAPGADTYTLIPRVLGEWAAELILNDSDVPPYIPEECHGVACSVDEMEGVSVTAPSRVNLPGLTHNKWAHKMSHQRHYRPPFNNESRVTPGYMPQCKTIYGAYIGDIDALIWNIACNIWSPADFIDEGNVFAYTPEHVLRAACQILSDLNHWEYFDTCSSLQCAIHLITQDYSPRDIIVRMRRIELEAVRDGR